MNATDLKFHDKLLRLLKGALRAYEEWLDAHRSEQTDTN